MFSFILGTLLAFVVKLDFKVHPTAKTVYEYRYDRLKKTCLRWKSKLNHKGFKRTGSIEDVTGSCPSVMIGHDSEGRSIIKAYFIADEIK